MDKKRKLPQTSGSQPIHHGKKKLKDVPKEEGPAPRTLDQTEKIENRLKYQNQLPPLRTTFEPLSSRSTYLDAALKRERERQKEQTIKSQHSISLVDEIMDGRKSMKSASFLSTLPSTPSIPGSKTGKSRSNLTLPKSSLPGIPAKPAATKSSATKVSASRAQSARHQSRIPKLSRQGSSDVAKDMTSEASKVMTSETAKDMTSEIAKDVTSEIAKDVTSSKPLMESETGTSKAGLVTPESRIEPGTSGLQSKTDTPLYEIDELGTHLLNSAGEVDMDLLIEDLSNDKTGKFYYLKPTSMLLPFRYKIVPLDGVDKNNLCTISAKAFTCYKPLCTESYLVPFQEWVEEYAKTKQLMQLKTFANCQYYKFYHKWRNSGRWERYQKSKCKLNDEAFILDAVMQRALCQIYNALADILHLSFYEQYVPCRSSTTVLNRSPQQRLELTQYLSYQHSCITHTWKSIEDYRRTIQNIILGVAETHLSQQGFTLDDRELFGYPVKSVDSRGAIQPFTATDSKETNRTEQHENAKFSRVFKKKKICERITRFILRIDYVMQASLKELLINSMKQFLAIVDRNLRFLPPQEVLEGDGIDQILESERPDEPKSPLFLISISTSVSDFVFQPLQREFIQAKDEIITRWFNLTLNVSNLMTDPALDSIIQPILGGKKFRYRLGGDGPDFKQLLDEVYHGLLEPWPLISKMEITSLSQSTTRQYSDVEPEKTLLQCLNEELDEKFDRNTDALDVYVRRFEDIRTSFKNNAFEDKNTFQGEKKIEEYREFLEKYQTQVSNLNKLIENQPLGLYLLQMQNLTQILMPKAEVLLENLKQILPKVGKERIASLTEKLIAAQSYLDQEPEETGHLMEYVEFLDSIATQVGEFDEELSYCRDLYALIEEFEIKYPFEDKTSYMVVTDLLHNLHTTIDNLVQNKDKLVGETFLEKILKDIDDLKDRIEDIRTKAEDPKLIALETPTPEALDKLDILLSELEDCQKSANAYKAYQKKFDVDVTEYPLLNQLLPDVRNRRKLRTSLTEWEDKVKEWTEGRFEELDADEMTAQVKTFGAQVASFEKTLPPNNITSALKQSVENMRGKLSVISALRNPSLEERHWDQIEALLDQKLDMRSLTLADLENMGAFELEDQINEISGRASAESALKTLLEKIETTWKNLEFTCIPHRDSKNVFILAGLEEVQTILDESLISLATILSSRQVAQIRESAEQWRQMLFLFSKTLDEWINFQNNWLYLESIFTGPDIQKQLPNESKLFTEVDKFWKDTMAKTAEKPQAFSTATSPDFLPAFQTNNAHLESILKSLESYLDVKRSAFPRFYFLSNEELLEILGQARNPQAVQPHLGKCFDGIAGLEFGTKKLKPRDPNDPNEEPRFVTTPDIVAMISPEQETVRLGKGLTARGSVEDWLSKVEKSMFITLRRLMKAALLDFSTRKRTEWVLRHPSQIVMWCAEITDILNPDMPDSVIDSKFKAFEQKCFRELNDLAAMVRGELTKLQRATLCALITIDVHARDIVSSMVRNQVRNQVRLPSSFEWLKQLRYYWDEEIDNCLGKMAFASFIYGYEYLGASPRLVITPLTDKCYLCLMGALQLNLGGAPAGPAGTGKTETTKDLAKSLAIQCVVFNCSDTLDYKIMGRFFGGMAQSGAWICFDEFNRIDIEVLSVIAQQLICITNAKMAGVSTFLFEGKMINLVPSCAAFITMNPGYAGRTELPDNLKALFRPMAMMVPDYGLIAEVVLYSEGFESSKNLAQKMVNMYKLCSEQLSQQDHYDFGMRAVKSVLVMAGSLKRANPDKNEDVVLIRALRDSNLPKFLADDAGLFLGILNDLFPGIVLPVEDYGSFQQAMEAVMSENNLQLEPGSFLKTIQLYETMLVRHGVMTVGPTGGGKTTVTNILKWTLTRLYETNVPGNFFRPVHTYTLNPKSVTSGELYGETNLTTMEWKDGLIGIFTRTAVQSTKDEHQWVICDGPIDAVWIENMNSVLDDNKLLCLANSERIKLTSWVHMMFEVQDLSQASPATVSRCGMVYVDAKTLGWTPYVKSWLKLLFDKVPLIREEFEEVILALFEKYVDPGLNFVRKFCATAIHQVDVSKARMICSLMESTLIEPGMLDRSHNSENTGPLLVQTFLWSYLWAVGGNLTDESRDRFEAFAREQFADEPNVSLGKDPDLRSYFVSKDTKQLTPWTTITPIFTYDPTMPFFDMMVPTIDTIRFGVGKTVVARSILNKLLASNTWAALTINFSAQTSSARTQEILEGKLDKRTKTLLGAPLGKRLAVFVDDVNMPKLETYGAQPPIELLRQFLDFGGLYDRDKMFWKTLQDVVLCTACAPPGGGRMPLTPRFVRHFGLLSLPSPTEDTLKSILTGFLSIFPPPVQSVSDAIINAAVEVYNRIAEDLLPTPAKSHYVFNLRDLSKCVQGILQASADSTKTTEDILRLYYHESLRVFHDRLINEQDKAYFYALMKQVCQKHFGTPVLEFDDVTVVQNPPVLLFGDFMSSASKEDRFYQEIKNVDKLKVALSVSLQASCFLPTNPLRITKRHNCQK
ncbi:hypothetical protein M8J76_013302 [Diaphorina citri]|nr:hypothetical protein M8J76_013302 [Diaphorina citri]